MHRRVEELDDFKSRINLSEYAAACGYRLDRKASSRNSAVMVRAAGDKVIIARGTDQHWIYFSIGEEGDSGSIIDFLQNRQGGTLGDVRKELRPWLEGSSSDMSRPPVDAFLPTLEPLVDNGHHLLGKLWMPWNPPLLKDGGHLSNRDSSIIQGTDNEVMRLHVGQLMPAIRVDSLGLRMPAVRKLADRAGYEARQIPSDEARVFASDLDLPGKSQVIADKHGRTHHVSD